MANTVIYSGLSLDEKVKAAIATCGVQGYIANIAKRQAEFEAIASSKGETHESALKATRNLSSQEKEWNSSAKALLAYLDKKYNPNVPGQRAERDRILRPLLEANAKARARSHKLPAQAPNGAEEPKAP